jgi:CubicO group peptidase (beta-lactamase class C family)
MIKTAIFGFAWKIIRKMIRACVDILRKFARSLQKFFVVRGRSAVFAALTIALCFGLAQKYSVVAEEVVPSSGQKSTTKKARPLSGPGPEQGQTQATCGAGAPRSAEDVIASLTQCVRKARVAWGVPGVSVGIYIDGKTFFINDGVLDQRRKPAEKDEANAVSEHSIFCVMSLSKIVTVIILQQLVDEGKISLDDPVSKFLPQFKLASEHSTKEMKIRHLVSHCSGLPKFSADTLWHVGCSQAEILEGLSKIGVVAKPGDKYAYQNMFVGIAGLLIEAVLKKPWAEIIQERVFDRVCMRDSSVGPHPRGFCDRVSVFFSRLAYKLLGWSPLTDPHDPA